MKINWYGVPLALLMVVGFVIASPLLLLLAVVDTLAGGRR